MSTKQPPFKNLHLLLSGVVVVILAGVYGFSPDKIIPALADIGSNPDVGNAFKAIMGLYLGIGFLWLLGTVRSAFWYPATLVNVFFMLGLSFGRLLSIAVDGFPRQEMVVGLLLELSLGIWGIINLRTYAKERI